MVSHSWWALLLAVAPAIGQGAQATEDPPFVEILDLSEHARLDPGLHSLLVVLSAPDDVARLREAPALRRLQLTSGTRFGTAPPGHGWWTDPELFEPLVALKELRWLQIGNFVDCDPDALRFVGRLLQLEELRLLGTSHVIDVSLATGLSKLPLRTAEFTGTWFDEGAFAQVCSLPLLERLELDLPQGLLSEDVEHFAQLREVRELSLRCWGHHLQLGMALRLKESGRGDPWSDEGPQVYDGPSGQRWQRRLGEQAGRALGRLWRLRSLDCSGSGIDDGFLGALPDRLTRLDLHGCAGLTVPEIGELRRIGALRHLIIDAEPSVELRRLPGGDAVSLDEAWAALLPQLPIEELTLHGSAGELLPDVLVKCPNLRTIHVRNAPLRKIVSEAVGKRITVTE